MDLTLSYILFLILGWLFGLLSPQIIEKIKRHYQKERLRCGLLAEMKEISIRLSMAVYLIAEEYGTFDRSLITWVQQHLERYEGGYATDRASEVLQKLSKCDDKQLAEISQGRRTEGIGLSLKTFSLPFLDSKMEYLSLFSTNSQTLIFEIRSQIHIINEEIENVQYYFRLTFDSTISTENHKIIRRNLKESYRNVERRAHIIVDKIDLLYKTKF